MNVEKRLSWCVWKGKRAISKISGKPIAQKKFNRKDIVNNERANALIVEAIQKKKPYMAGRYGSSELNAIWRVKDDYTGIDVSVESALKQVCLLSGFFPCEEKYLIDFAKTMHQSTGQVDLMAVWYQLMEEYELRKWGHDLEYCTLGGLEPFFVDNPWTESLKGKEVLVIHPFSESIKIQYQKRALLFQDERILPEFNLKVQQAVQTIAGNMDQRFSNWFEALDFMTERALNEEFDVAIIGCGAYGFPLAARIKKAGKIAIHLGGATQLLFGIKGNRWDSQEAYRKLQNEHWIRAFERPENADKVENACYW